MIRILYVFPSGYTFRFFLTFAEAKFPQLNGRKKSTASFSRLNRQVKLDADNSRRWPMPDRANHTFSYRLPTDSPKKKSALQKVQMQMFNRHPQIQTRLEFASIQRSALLIQAIPQWLVKRSNLVSIFFFLEPFRIYFFCFTFFFFLIYVHPKGCFNIWL